MRVIFGLLFSLAMFAQVRTYPSPERAQTLNGKPLCSATVTQNCVPSADANGNVSIGTTVTAVPSGGDDTAALNALVTANADVYLSPGTYNLTGSIVLPSNHKLRGGGAGTILKAANPASATSTLASNGAQNASTVTLSDASAFSVGMWIWHKLTIWGNSASVNRVNFQIDSGTVRCIHAYSSGCDDNSATMPAVSMTPFAAAKTDTNSAKTITVDRFAFTARVTR